MAVTRDVLEAIHQRRSGPNPGSDLFATVDSFRQTPAEVSAGVTPVNYAYGFGDPRRYGAKCDGTTNDSAALAKCVSVGLCLLPDATTVGTLSIQQSGMIILGTGNATCIIKNPSGTLSTGGVIEVGNTALGNSAPAYSNFTARGFTIDGNRANATAPVDDLHGHGICLTKISNYDIDVFVQNAWNAGCGLFINSNFGQVKGQSANCGNATFTPPGLDINACKHVAVNWISDTDNVGFRLLNNCNNITGMVDAYNATAQAFILQNNNVSGNTVHTCNLSLSADTCGSHGLLMQEGVRDNVIRAAIINAGAVGCQLVAGSTSTANCMDNILDLVTENSQQQGLLSGGADRNTINHISRLDGRSGVAGSYYALDWTGNNNVITSVVDGDGQVRGFAIRAGSTSNTILAAQQTNCLSGYSDSGTSTSLVPTTFQTTLSGTYNLTSGAAPIVVTAAVSGVAFGDQVQVAWPSDLQGAIAWAYVQSAGHVSVAAYNITGGALNFGAITVTLRITKA